uniref:EF-hand domain-containing protein n=1 Tax=Clastoptera arizonana TaxID=38151 RepID=A0A1B6E6N5_9HEMI
MDINGIDPYEQQLLAVFESCDRGGKGQLDSEGLVTLCQKLHLEQGQDELMRCLLGAKPGEKAVFTFAEFRDALLALLGAERRQSEDEREPSPEREVSPKFVFGQKKYGRRSRPESTDQEGGDGEESIEESDSDPFLPNVNNEKDLKNKTGDKVLIEDDKEKNGFLSSDSITFISEKEELGSPRGQGEAELRAASKRLGIGTDGFLDQAELASVCRAVGMEKIANEVVKQVFAKLDVDGSGSISFEDFLQLFRTGTPPSPSHLALSPLPQSFHQPNLTSLEISPLGCISTENVIELWELAGVTDANRLLHDLGLGGSSEVNLSLLSSVLEEEIRNMRAENAKNSSLYSEMNYQVSLLTASLALAHVQLKYSKSTLEQITCERDKLRNDLIEANQRASLLAQEVDDRHARMERASQMQIKLLEQKHSDQVKQLGLQLVADREQMTAVTHRLEKKLTQQQEDEVKVRATLLSLQKEYETMEKENRNLSDRLCLCEAAKTKAEKEVLKVETLERRVNELESNGDQVASLIEKLAKLQSENTSLRDRNDELSIQVETLSTKVTHRKPYSSISLEGCIGGGTKRRGNSPLGLPPDDCWDDDSPRLGKVRRCCTENDLSLDNVPMEGLAIRPLRHSESGLEADLDTLDDSLTLSNSSNEKVNFKFGSESNILYEELERLRSRNAELEQTVEQFQIKGVNTNAHIISN